MKSPLLLTAALLFVLHFSSMAQIENEIASFVDSTEIMINNGRRLLLSKTQEGDFDKANDVYHYLNEKTASKQCAAFYFEEEMCFLAIWGHWDYWLKRAEEYISIENSPICYSNLFVIENQLYQELEKRNGELSENISKSVLSDEEKSVLLLYLHVVKNGIHNEEYTKKFRAFKRTYPTSKFNLFVSKFLPSPAVKAAMGVAIGSTIVFPTNDLKNMFASNGTFYMSLDFNFGKVYSSLHFCGGTLHLKEEFVVDYENQTLTFKAGEDFNYFDGGFMLGYFLVRNKHLQLAPYFNFAGTSVESMMYDSYSDQNEYMVFDSFTYGPGLHTEFKLYEPKAKTNPYPYNYYYKSYFSAKIDVGYNQIVHQQNKLFTGDVVYLKLGIVFGLGEF